MPLVMDASVELPAHAKFSSPALTSTHHKQFFLPSVNTVATHPYHAKELFDRIRTDLSELNTTEGRFNCDRSYSTRITDSVVFEKTPP